MNPGDAASPGPIIVGAERSERSRDALALAGVLARAIGTRLILVAVHPRDALGDGGAGGLREDARGGSPVDTRLGGSSARRGPRRVARVPCSSIARGLRQVAADEDARAIVVGPSHRGPVGRVVPGSVGSRLLHGAPCPVTLAPTGYRGETHAPIRRIGVGYVDMRRPARR